MRSEDKKILHFTFMPSISVGILEKIRNAASVAFRENIPIYFCVLTDNEMDDEPHLFFIKNKYSVFKRIIFINLFKNQMLFDHIDSDPYDYIFFRYIMSPGIFAGYLPKRLRNKIISEHHTKERDEIIINHKRGLKKYIDVFFEEFFGRRFLQKCIGITGVSKEIMEFEKNRGINLPGCEISNGIDVEKTKFTSFVPFDGKKIRLIALSSTFYKWQGLDRLLKSVLRYDGRIDIHIDIVGNVIYRKEKELIVACRNRKNVSIYEHGVLEKKDIEKIIGKSNLAVSTLCLYRKKIKCTSSIKNCEFMARGLPFILGHNDPNISKRADYVFRVSNTSEIFDIEKVIEFFKRLSEDRTVSHRMREFAFKNIDCKVKLKKMLSFALNL